jgi:hypothetical protein
MIINIGFAIYFFSRGLFLYNEDKAMSILNFVLFGFQLGLIAAMVMNSLLGTIVP